MTTDTTEITDRERRCVNCGSRQTLIRNLRTPQGEIIEGGERRCRACGHVQQLAGGKHLRGYRDPYEFLHTLIGQPITITLKTALPEAIELGGVRLVSFDHYGNVVVSRDGQEVFIRGDSITSIERAEWVEQADGLKEVSA